jgi:Na+/H+ antiporter NhaD/arsenite permease-like protein
MRDAFSNLTESDCQYDIHLLILNTKIMKLKIKIVFLLFALFIPVVLMANMQTKAEIAGIKIEFILFGLTLLGIVVFHKEAFLVAITGLILITACKLSLYPNFSLAEHITGNNFGEGEWKTLLNLFLLLPGFAVLAKIFETSNVPQVLPKILPDNWLGGFYLLLIILILSSFLDNIAAALIGGTIAAGVYQNKVHIMYIVSIIAASNAGGAGSIIGDTTTTMMWIDGISPLTVLPAYIASIGSFISFAFIASYIQQKHQPIQKDVLPGVEIKTQKLLSVVIIIFLTIAGNYALDFPSIGVWSGIIISGIYTSIPYKESLKMIKSTLFLLCLVFSASLMPIEDLPQPSVISTFSFGFISAFFDNIPLTKLCLEQSNYDWALLAFAVGFGGSMIWFGSSAGVALTNQFPESQSAIKYLKNSWHVIIAYIVGYILLYLIMGWNPVNHKL